MKYTNLQILNELKHIKKCSEDDSMDNIAKCIYNGNNTGILNYLSENKYINMNECSSIGRTIPFLNSYGNDFLKYNNLIKCFIKDYQWLINTIILIIITIICGILINITNHGI